MSKFMSREKPVWKEELFKEEVSHLFCKSLPQGGENRRWKAGVGGLKMKGEGLEQQTGIRLCLRFCFSKRKPLHLLPVLPALIPNAEHDPLDNVGHHLTFQVLQLGNGFVEHSALDLTASLFLHPLLLELQEERGLSPGAKHSCKMIHCAEDWTEVGDKGIFLFRAHQLDKAQPEVFNQLQLKLKKVNEEQLV